MGKEIGLGALKEVAQKYNIPIKEIASTVYYKAYQRLLFDKLIGSIKEDDITAEAIINMTKQIKGEKVNDPNGEDEYIMSPEEFEKLKSDGELFYDRVSGKIINDFVTYPDNFGNCSAITDDGIIDINVKDLSLASKRNELDSMVNDTKYSIGQEPVVKR